MSSTSQLSCLEPFHRFAYWPDNTTHSIQIQLPQPPWNIETNIPINETDASISNPYFIQLHLSRNTENGSEIWLYKNPRFSLAHEPEKQDPTFLVYQPEGGTWQEVSAFVSGTKILIDQILVDNEGTIWAKSSYYQPYIQSSQISLISKFNDSTKRFESVDIDFLASIHDSYLAERVELIIDQSNVLWAFRSNGFVYRYNQEIKHFEKYSEFLISDRFIVTLGIEGAMYVKDVGSSRDEPFLFRFNSKTGSLIPLRVPTEPWRVGSGILVDQAGRLWLGVIGFMDSDGELQLMHEDAPNIWDHKSEIPIWSPPTLMFESSNGVLWYSEYHDMHYRGEGTAWYNPQTNEGCLFTNVASNIVEDSNKNLWISAGGHLYKYSITGSDVQWNENVR